MPRPTRNSTDRNANAYRAALMGDACPEGFNAFIYFDLQHALRGFDCPQTAAMRELWQIERDALLREWARRGERGTPPGAVFDRPIRGDR
jgi:hypothetical protein